MQRTLRPVARIRVPVVHDVRGSIVGQRQPRGHVPRHSKVRAAPVDLDRGIGAALVDFDSSDANGHGSTPAPYGRDNANRPPPQ